MSLVIYTTIFGNYDKLIAPKVVANNVKYVCFTDKKIKCYPWEIRVVKPEFKDLIRENRKYKILSHKYFNNFQYSIYIDGNFQILVDLSQFIDKLLGDNDIGALRHPYRNCLYKEAYMCIKKKKDNIQLIEKQIKRYHKEGYPENNGLTANGFIIRRNTEKIKRFNEMWWNEVKNYSKRDQISFKYVLYKMGIECSIIPNSKSYASEYIRYLNHINTPKFIYLDKMIKLVKPHFTNKSLLRFLFLKLLPYENLIPLINNNYIKNVYHQIKVPLGLYYFVQYF